MEDPKTGARPQRHQRRHRTKHSSKPNPYRRIESLISKHLLKVIGFIFILAVAGYSVSSLGKLKGIVKQFSSQEKVMQTVQSPAAVQVGGEKITTAEAFQTADVQTMIILGCIITLLFAALLLFSVRIHRKEIPRIAGTAFYVIALLMAGKYGWQIHVLFPMIFVFSALIFYSGIKLGSMVAGKWNFLVCWGFFLIWWVMRMILGGDAGLLWSFFLYGSLFYLLFLYMGAYGQFKGRHKFSNYTEIGLIIANLTVFYLMGIVSLIKFRHMEYAWIFSLGLVAVNFSMLVLASNADKKLQSGPYVFPAMIILSLIIPFYFPASAILLFLAIASCLLLFYSKYSGDKVAVITALLSMALMLLVYFKDWVFQYLPAAFLGNVLDNPGMMTKGLVAGLVIFPVMIINSRLMKRLHVGFSKEWFSRRSYQSLFKGVNLIVLYLSGFWIVNYVVLVWSKNPDLNFMSWFGYNCLFFLITIPALVSQQSKFIAPAIGFAMFFSLAYPSLIHFTTLDLRNELLLHEHLSRLGFWFHYPVVLLFVAEIIMLEAYMKKAFETNALLVRVFTFYLLFMGLFILLSEYDHFSIWTGLRRGITIEEIALADRVIPYTFLLLAYSSLILVIGMAIRNRLLRAAGLIFLLGTLVKILYIDLRALSGTTRSAVLFAVGIIVLTLSFMYPRLKRYFRHREHETSGVSRRHRHHSHSRSQAKPGDVKTDGG